MRRCYMDEEFSAGAIIFRRKGKKICFSSSTVKETIYGVSQRVILRVTRKKKTQL